MVLDAETIDQIAEALSARLPVMYPIEIDIWGAKEVAGFLKVSPQQVLSRYACLPDFPKTIRLPTNGPGRGHPKWRAKDVVNWAFGNNDGYRVATRGRPRNS